jgi:hypothetical protein
MANKDKAFGLRPIESKDGYGWNGKVTKYFIPSTVANVGLGDCILKSGTTNTATIQGYKAGTLPAAGIAATNGAVTGVVVGFEPLSDESSVYGKTGVDRVAHVVDDPRVVFEAQYDGTLAAVNVGLNADRTLGTVDTITNLSGDEIKSTGIAVTATLQFKILKLVNEENNALGANAKVEVIINNHTESNNTAGV